MSSGDDAFIDLPVLNRGVNKNLTTKNNTFREPLLHSSNVNDDGEFDYENMIDTDSNIGYQSAHTASGSGLFPLQDDYYQSFGGGHHAEIPDSFSVDWTEIPEINADGMDMFLTKMYRYFLNRGYWNILLSQVIQLLILTFFVLFCLFIFGAVDYKTLLSFRDHSKNYPFSDVVHFEWLKSMNVYFIMSLIVYGIYLCWKIVKIFYDAKTMYSIKKFYHIKLRITDFELQTIRWTTIVKALNTYISQKGYETLENWDICARIMKKDNYLIALVHHNKLQYGIPVCPISADNFVRNTLRRLGFDLSAVVSQDDSVPRLRLKMFSRTLLWSITYCIMNFIIDENNELKSEFLYSDREHIRDDLIGKLQKRFRIVAILNLLLLPFLALFVPMYAIFQYGEQFYKNPSSATTREWSFFSKWKF